MEFVLIEEIKALELIIAIMPVIGRLTHGDFCRYTRTMYGWILVKRNEKGPVLEAKLLPKNYNIYIFQLPFRDSVI